MFFDEESKRVLLNTYLTFVAQYCICSITNNANYLFHFISKSFVRNNYQVSNIPSTRKPMRALPRIIYQQQRVCNEHTTARSLTQLATALHKRKNTYTDTYRVRLYIPTHVCSQ